MRSCKMRRREKRNMKRREMRKKKRRGRGIWGEKKGKEMRKTRKIMRTETRR